MVKEKEDGAKSKENRGYKRKYGKKVRGGVTVNIGESRKARTITFGDTGPARPQARISSKERIGLEL
jgi:hypothetical protein